MPGVEAEADLQAALAVLVLVADSSRGWVVVGVAAVVAAPSLLGALGLGGGLLAVSGGLGIIPALVAATAQRR